VQCSGTFLPCKIESLVFYVVFVISKKEAAEADVGASPLVFWVRRLGTGSPKMANRPSHVS
jgi:hypothetical protein